MVYLHRVSYVTIPCRREDGKDGMQFYTDPNYFFELWRQEMLKENDRLMHEKGKKVSAPVAS